MPEDPFGLVYIKGKNSIFHKMNPIDKLIILGCIVILVLFSMRNVYHILILLLLIVIGQFLCGPTLRQWVRPQKLFIPIFILFAFVVAFTFNLQSSIVGIGGPEDIGYLNILGVSIPYSKMGWRYGYYIAFRGITVGMAALILAWSTHPRDLVYSLVNTLKINYRIAWGGFLALIYSPLIAYEGTMINYAQKVRGIKYNKWNIIELSKNLAIPLIVRGAKRAMITSMALDTRGFGAFPDRTFRFKPPQSKFSRIFAILVLCLTAIYVWYNPPGPIYLLWAPG